MMNQDKQTTGCCGGANSAKGTASAAPLDPTEICTLSSEELSERIAWIRAEISPAALGRERIPNGVALEVADAPGLADRVDEWIALERQCCTSIDWQRRPSERRGQLRVEIGGVDPDGSLFAAWPLLEDDASAPSVDAGEGGSISRLLRASGFGAGISFFVCCILPALLVAVFGASALAASLSWLDQPLWIGIGAVLASVAAWRRMGQRRQAS